MQQRMLKGILTGILTGALAITTLGDPTTETADVIVRGADVSAVAAAVLEHGGDIEFEIGLIDAVSADVPVHLVDELEADARTSEVTPDAPVQLLSLATAETLTGQSPVDAITALGGTDMVQNGYDGTGIDIAIIDSGVDGPALKYVQVQQGIDLSFSSTNARDGYGHGTAMAGIIGSTAPGSRIIDVKVADERGLADVSQVLAGIDWTVANRDSNGRNIRVLSLSFGTDGTNPAATSPLAYAVEAAWRHGITVAVSAGNHGADLGRLMTPAISPWVIAVGAADTRTVGPDTLGTATVPAWSAVGDRSRSPDLVAPGRSILGGLSPESAIALDNPQAVIDGQLLGSGTSQATAFTAGIAANLLEARSDLTPDELKALLVGSATRLKASSAQSGAGLLNLDALFSPDSLNGRLKSTQRHGWSDGTGSLDGDRGHYILEGADGTRLAGEETVWGAFERDAWLGSTWTGSTWTGSTWTGSTWTGSTWTGSTWTGSTWTGSTWTGSTWTGSTWTGSTWTGSTWTGSTWTTALWGA